MHLPPSTRPKAYISVSFPSETFERIKEFIEKDPTHSYVSVLEFMKDAVRRRLEELHTQRRAAALGDKLDAMKPDADRAAAKIRAGAPNAKPRYCHKCGELLPAGAGFCPACGTRSG